MNIVARCYHQIMRPFSALRRKRPEKGPFPIGWLAVLRRNCRYYRLLSASQRRELLSLIQIFLAEKNFEGCAGFEIDDEVRVTIASHACLLLLNRRASMYPALQSILVYPSEYITRSHRPVGEGFLAEFDQMRLGEAWKHGIVILSWDEIESSITDRQPGHNLILHEFAHQLDFEDGNSDGTPILDSIARYREWGNVMGREFANLRDRLDRGESVAIDEYAATSPAEFFAVTTETFFDAPNVLGQHHPEIYRLLSDFFRQDPVSFRPILSPMPLDAEFDPRFILNRHFLFDVIMVVGAVCTLVFLGEYGAGALFYGILTMAIVVSFWLLMPKDRKRS